MHEHCELKDLQYKCTATHGTQAILFLSSMHLVHVKLVAIIIGTSNTVHDKTFVTTKARPPNYGQHKHTTHTHRAKGGDTHLNC